MTELETFKKDFKLAFYSPYPKQVQFHSLGATKRERNLMAANRSGKTFCAAHEVAFHMTGLYPDWWQGKRFDKATTGWVGSETAELTREGAQRELLGQFGQFGTAAIPKTELVDWKQSRGVPEAIEIFRTKHVSGGISQCTFKAFADGREKWQAATLDWVWMDEEPDEDIYSEALTRTNTTGGIVMLTATPLKGMSNVVMRFISEKSDDRAMVNMTIDDAGHFTDEVRQQIIRSYRPHEVEARTKGIPMLGSGRIFPLPEAEIREPTIVVPDHWYQIIGMDMGWDHPTAAVKIVASTTDIATADIHVVRAYRKKEETTVIHAAAIKTWGAWVPVAWPLDALQHDKGSGEQLANIYRRQGLKMISEHAQFPDDRGIGVEAGIAEMLHLMQTGRFHVDENLHEWFEEFRMYHRKDGKVVKERDDLLCATRYALMMLRFAVPYTKGELKRDRYMRKAYHGGSWMSA